MIKNSGIFLPTLQMYTFGFLLDFSLQLHSEKILWKTELLQHIFCLINVNKMWQFLVKNTFIGLQEKSTIILN